MAQEFTEIEVKLTLHGEGAMERVLDALDPPVRKMEQINFYLDTPSRVLHSRKVMLRMRKQGDEAIFTLKTDAEIVRGGLRCREVEERIPWVEAEGALRDGFSGFSLGPLEEVRDLWSESDPLGVIGQVVNLRRWIPFEDLGTVELDHMTLPGGVVHMELELETHSERLDECIARMETFLSQLGVAYSDKVVPKYVRFLEALQTEKG